MELVEVFTQGISDDWHAAHNRFYIVNRGYCTENSLFDILRRFRHAAGELNGNAQDACLLLNGKRCDYLLRIRDGRLYLDNKNDPGAPMIRVEPETIVEYLESEHIDSELKNKIRLKSVIKQNFSVALSGSLIGSFIGLAIMILMVLFAQ